MLRSEAWRAQWRESRKSTEGPRKTGNGYLGDRKGEVPGEARDTIRLCPCVQLNP